MQIAQQKKSSLPDPRKISQAYKKVNALNHKLRWRILKALNEVEMGMTVTELFIKMRVEQSVMSQHLALLREAGFVNTDKQGKFVFYTVDMAEVHRVFNSFKKLSA